MSGEEANTHGPTTTFKVTAGSCYYNGWCPPVLQGNKVAPLGTSAIGVHGFKKE